MDRKEIKKRAKEVAFNNKWNLWKPYVIYMVITFCCGFVSGFFGLDSIVIIGEFTANSLLESIVGIATIPMLIGVIYNNMAVIEGKKLSLKEVFTPQYNRFWLIYITTFIVSLLTGVLCIFLIVPGVIYALKMSMTRMILADPEYSNLSYKEVQDLSAKMMNGHKWEFVVFQLSFILWYMLISITLGIAIIWVEPYVQTATVMYYQELKKLVQA